jgi:hypothetical protein
MHAAASCTAPTTAIELRRGGGEHAPKHGTRLPCALSSAASGKRGSGTTGHAPSNGSLLLGAGEPHGSAREEAVLVLRARQPGWAKGDASRPSYALRHTLEARVKRVCQAGLGHLEPRKVLGAIGNRFPGSSGDRPDCGEELPHRNFCGLSDVCEFLPPLPRCGEGVDEPAREQRREG